MLAQVLSQLGIDNTLWYQLAIFIIFFVVVRFLFFKPFLELILMRKTKTTGVEGEASTLVKQAEDKEEEYRQKLYAARVQARRIRDEILQESKDKASVTLALARKAAKNRIESGREEIIKESEKAMKDLESHVGKISSLFVDKVMKSGVGV